MSIFFIYSFFVIYLVLNITCMEHLKKQRGKEIKHDNALTESRYSFSPVEKRCYYLILEKIRRDFIETERGQKDLLNDFIIKIDAKDLEKAGDNHTKVFKSLQSLREKEIYIETKTTKLTTGYINYVEYHKKNKTYEVGVTHKILPYLVELANEYTSYNFVVAMSLKSEYSQRFFEMCCQYRNKGKFFKSEDQLRKMFMLENKYKSTYDFKKYTIKRAEKELKTLFDENQSDIYFTTDVKEKEGKKEVSWWFTIHDRVKPKGAKIDYKQTYSISHQTKLLLNRYFPRDKKYIERVTNEMQLNPPIIEELAEKLQRIIKKYPSEEVPKVIRMALKVDFEIQ